MSDWLEQAAQKLSAKKEEELLKIKNALREAELLRGEWPVVWRDLRSAITRNCAALNAYEGMSETLACDDSKGDAVRVYYAVRSRTLEISLVDSRYEVEVNCEGSSPRKYRLGVIFGTRDVKLFDAAGHPVKVESIAKQALEELLGVG